MSLTSKRSLEGYFLLDNRESPGLSDDLVRSVGLPVGAGRGQFEAPTITCSHCHRVVVLNPLRTRDRAWCAKCDHYLCDACGVVLAQTGVCKTLNQLFDELQEQAIQADRGSGVLP